VFGRAGNNHGDNKLVGGGFYIFECFLILRHEKTAGFHVSAIEMAVRIFAHTVFFYF
jgi:hypothetical protein